MATATRTPGPLVPDPTIVAGLVLRRGRKDYPCKGNGGHGPHRRYASAAWDKANAEWNEACADIAKATGKEA